jgi:hypothetical protein
VTGSEASKCFAWCPLPGPPVGSALPFTGSSEASSPASTVLWRCATSCAPLARLGCLRRAIPCIAAGRQPGPPKFLGNPDCFYARFFDSGRTACPHCHDGAAAWPPLRVRRGLPHWDFRSSIARPQSWLSTLRRVGHPTATQDSLPGAGQALLGGLGYPQGLIERFQSDLIRRVERWRTHFRVRWHLHHLSRWASVNGSHGHVSSRPP